MNKSMEVYELFFRYVFVITSLIVLAYFIFRTNGVNSPFYSYTLEQKWITILLVLLILFNNPIYGIETFTYSPSIHIFESMFNSLFINCLFLFWLCVVDGLRFERTERHFKSFYLPKFILIGILWIMMTSVFLWTRTHNHSDPQYETINDVPKFRVFRIIIVIIVIIYILWLGYAIIRAFREIKTSIPSQKVRFKFFFYTSLIIWLFPIILSFGGFLTNLGNSALLFLSSFTFFNVYVWGLTYAYCPSKRAIMEDIIPLGSGSEVGDIQDIFGPTDDDSLSEHLDEEQGGI